MSADQLGLPAFTPVPARPAQLPPANSPPTQPAGKTPKKPKVAKVAKAAKVPKKKRAAVLAAAKEAIKARGVNPEPVKRVRSTRVAALTLDAAGALAALAGMSKRELEAMQTLIAQLNPLPRPARKRVLDAVIKIAGAS